MHTALLALYRRCSVAVGVCVLVSGGVRISSALTICAESGRFGSIEHAANADSLVDWWDGDERDARACTESFAATELALFLPRCLSGSKDRIRLDSSGRLPATDDLIVLGSDTRGRLLSSVTLPASPGIPRDKAESFRVVSIVDRGRRVWVIQGTDRVGVLYGAYALLEQLGMRFYGLGEAGTVWPGRPTRLSTSLRLAESPGFRTRGFWAWEPRGNPEFFLWMARNRMNLWTSTEPAVGTLEKLGIQLSAGGHGVQMNLINPNDDYPFTIASIPSTSGRQVDPYPASQESRGDINHDGRVTYFEAHPEWYALINGQRSNRTGTETGDNFCTTNPDARREFTRRLVEELIAGRYRHADLLLLWMFDQGRWCQCAKCRARGSETDRLFDVIVAAQQAIRAARADGRLQRPVRLESLAFLETLSPPTHAPPIDCDSTGFTMGFFPIDRCYAHAIADSTCTEINKSFAQDIRAWAMDAKRNYRGPLGVGEYYNIGEFKSLPIVLTHVIASDLPWYYGQGVRDFMTMHAPTRLWGTWTLNHVLMSRLLWDPTANSQAIVAEYYARYYPSSPTDMRAFYEALERATANLKILKHRVNVHGQIFDLDRQLRSRGSLLPLEHLQERSIHQNENDAPGLRDMEQALATARGALARARSTVSGGVERARIEDDARRFDYGEATILFIVHLIRCTEDVEHRNLRAAKEEMATLSPLAERLGNVTDIVQVASSHANATNGLEATRLADVYEKLKVACAPTVIPPSTGSEEAFRVATAALLWPGTTRSFLLVGDGLLENGEWAVQMDPSSDGVLADSARSIAYDEDGSPIAHWSRKNGDVLWTFEAVALPAPGDSGVIASLEVHASNRGERTHDAALRAWLRSPPIGSFIAPDSPESLRAPYVWAGPRSRSPVEGWCDGRARGGTAMYSWQLKSGETRSARFELPSYRIRAKAISKWALITHRANVAEARRYWSKLLNSGMQLIVNDRDAERAYREAVVVLLGCTQRHEGRWIIAGNPFQYRDIWLRDGARCVSALSMAGYVQRAREIAAGFLAFQWPQGAFLSQRGQLDGTGQVLWAFDQVFLRPAADKSIDRYATASLAAWRWCESQRASTQILGLPFGGLMPYCDPRDGELVRAQLVGTDAWAIAGYRATTRLLEAAGRKLEASQVRRAQAGYLSLFQRTIERLPEGDVPPSWQGDGLDWGNLSVGYPCDALPLEHPRLAALAHRMWGDVGGPGLVRYGEGDTLHTYLSADLGEWALLTNRPQEANAVLSSLLRWRTASGGSPEVFSVTNRDFGQDLPPHATAAAAIVMFVRNSLISDDSDTLRLTLGPRETWWKNGSVQRAPTRWGSIDLSFQSDGRTAEWTWTPVAVPTALTVPAGARLRRNLTDSTLRVLSSRVILAPAGAHHVHVELETTPAGQ
jgi:hypothetical protein